MWKTIENSYFWLTYSLKSKQLVLRFLNPLSSRVKVYRVSFTTEVINLVEANTYSEKILLLQKRKTTVLKELNSSNTKQKQKLEQELLEINNKMNEVKHAAHLH